MFNIKNIERNNNKITFYTYNDLLYYKLIFQKQFTFKYHNKVEDNWKLILPFIKLEKYKLPF